MRTGRNEKTQGRPSLGDIRSLRWYLNARRRRLRRRGRRLEGWRRRILGVRLAAGWLGQAFQPAGRREPIILERRMAIHVAILRMVEEQIPRPGGYRPSGLWVHVAGVDTAFQA